MKEGVYRRCLAHALQCDGYDVKVGVPLDVEFEGLHLDGALEMDLVVNDVLMLELKAREVPLEVWKSQVLSYLEHSGLPLGYLINFRVTHLRRGITPFVNLPEGLGPQIQRPSRFSDTLQS